MNPLEQYLPLIKNALLVIIPALFIYFVEQGAVNSWRQQAIEAKSEADTLKKEIAEPKRVLLSNDVDNLNKLEKSIAAVQVEIDKYQATKVDEMVCIQGMRNSVVNYLDSIVNPLRQLVVLSGKMKNADDVKYIDQQVQSSVKSTLAVTGNLRSVAQSLGSRCNGSLEVAHINGEVYNLLYSQLTPMYVGMQGRLAKEK